MPRKKLKPKLQLEYLSVLDDKGKLDKDLEPKIDGKTLKRMHRVMLLCRRFDEHLLKWQRQGRVGTFAPVKGQEASQIGSVAALKDEDWVVPSFRETAVALWRGTPLTGLILYNAGYNEGGQIPENQNDLPISIPVASQMCQAVGIAYAMKIRREKKVTMVYFGDGATSEGDFHESLNMAQVFNTPTVFLCQNNHWAISVPREQQTASSTLAQKALAYGMPGIQVDGNDLLAVYAATQEAVERARKGEGPTLIECVTYRLSVHTTADDPSKYRSDDEVETWMERDPIIRMQQYLKDKKLLTEKQIKKIDEEVVEEVNKAWDEAAEQMEDLGDPLDMFDHVYADMPPYLKEQRDALKQSMEVRRG
ncbi:pyruvate dehydrogenase (acetyl-transferring) E1 component subunit alpha [Marinobacter salicampi]|uniref:pyruvate dehydrogenase (acetyl-transferring) E1 component subunit alpha n=1 Tax=Marinobacter salicampi TaxID=435907 RepID=UPI00140A2B43|nr:pyruvate dehydrogenase (acetyl-transferring) E1 component subunit alpha [Marinobacter salicampi]